MEKSVIFSLIIALMLMLSLSLFILLPISIKQINSPSEINHYENNQKLIVRGLVIKQTQSTIKLDNNLYLYCSSCPSLTNKTIEALAVVSSYYNNKSLEVLQIKEIKKIIYQI